LRCKRCVNGLYASQACDSKARPILKAIRIRNLLSIAPHKPSRIYNRLRALCIEGEWHSKRITERILRPRQRYRLTGQAYLNNIG
jgi:hypothetical protein